MAADQPIQGKPNDDVIAVSDEALQKAEAFVEAEEGAANRLMGWPGRISTAIAVVMSLLCGVVYSTFVTALFYWLVGPRSN